MTTIPIPSQDTPIYNILIKKYATFKLSLTWKTGGTTSVPIDLTNFRAILQIRQSADVPNVLYEASTTKGNIKLGGANGTISVSISSVDTSNIRWQSGEYDLLLIGPDGTVYKMIRGSVSVETGITQPNQ